MHTVRFATSVSMTIDDYTCFMTLSLSAGKSQFGSLWSLGHSPGKQDRLYMKGPGGRGEVEVAVSGVVGRTYTLRILVLSLVFVKCIWVHLLIQI